MKLGTEEVKRQQSKEEAYLAARKQCAGTLRAKGHVQICAADAKLLEAAAELLEGEARAVLSGAIEERRRHHLEDLLDDGLLLLGLWLAE